MRHTDCGTAYWTDEGHRAMLRERVCAGADAEREKGLVGRRGEKLEDIGFCESQGNMEELVKKDIEWLKGSPLIREETRKRIVGAMYHTETGVVDIIC